MGKEEVIGKIVTQGIVLRPFHEWRKQSKVCNPFEFLNTNVNGYIVNSL